MVCAVFFFHCKRFFKPSPDCLNILMNVLVMRLWIFPIYLNEHVRNQWKCVTGLRWWWWWCTEVTPGVMDLFQRYLNMHSCPPAFADRALSCLFYQQPCFIAACLTSHCFFKMSSYLCGSNCWCSERCSTVILLYHHVCRCAAIETHSGIMRLQILFDPIIRNQKS